MFLNMYQSIKLFLDMSHGNTMFFKHVPWYYHVFEHGTMVISSFLNIYHGNAMLLEMHHNIKLFVEHLTM